MPLLKKSSFAVVLQVRNSDGTPYTTGGTPPTVVISKDAGAQAAAANVASHKGNGRWRLMLSSGDGGETDADLIDVSWSGSGLLTDGISIYTEAVFTSAPPTAAQVWANGLYDPDTETNIAAGTILVNAYGNAVIAKNSANLAKSAADAAKLAAQGAATPGAAMSLTSAERTTLAGVVSAALDLPAKFSALKSSVLSWVRLLARKDAPAPAAGDELGGTFNAATDSLEAAEERPRHTAADIAKGRTADAITASSGGEQSDGTFKFPQSDGLNATVSVASTGKTRTVTVA